TRSTKIAPLSLSTSYFTGSESFGISMMTLISSGGLLPAVTLSRPMGISPTRDALGAAGGGGSSWAPILAASCCDAASVAQRPVPAANSDARENPSWGTPQLGQLH